MNTLTAIQRKRLARLLELIIDDRDAARNALHIVTSAGMSWSDLLKPPPVHREPLHSIWRTTCAQLLQHDDALKAWEKTFVRDLPNFRRISPKQRYILHEIKVRVLGEKL